MKADISGIDPDLITHKLNVDPTRKAVKQKKRIYAPDRLEAIKQDVEKLQEVGFIKEVQFPEWLANPVMVKKANGKWRTFLNFLDLNDACPKDCYPLLRIDTLIDATDGHEILSFMDGFSGATYQRLLNKIFSHLIVKTMEVYVDYMLIKSLAKADHINYLKEAFEVLRHHKMMLNPSKCAFGVGSRKFLGHMVSKKGIEANPDNIKAILDMKPPHSIKDVQKLTGRIATQGKFIYKSGDKCLPFFKTLKKVKNLEWISESQKAFEQLKKYMIEAPLLAKPSSEDVLYLYLAIQSKLTLRLDGFRQKARKLWVRALRYSLIEGLLYKRSFVIPYLKYLRPLEAEKALKESYEGICGLHLEGSALAHKISRLGLYWPTMLADAKAYPPEKLTSISTPITFTIWGIDILGPFPVASGQRKFIVVAIDYFTKWIVIKALTKITTKKISQFYWDNVICRFEFKEYYDNNSIELRFTSVAHPHVNGKAEVTNRIILDGLKKRVERSTNTWADELLPILWAYRTTCKVTTEAYPFMLAYGTEVVVPLEITHGSPRVEAYESKTNKEGMRLTLDLIDEVRDEANACKAEH
ncbi:uncharacterized protein LOC141714369 [Apium graveolens]|uniref:uncharacterized protein LOC141714369 n=1 Tax=Apium graveolens TaxID=4045 RepID=UPI003D78DAA1